MAIPLPEKIQTAIITGGAKGLGAQITCALHAAGFRVVIADATPDRGAALASALDLAGETALTITLDPAQAGDYQTTLDKCLERWGSVEVLVHADTVDLSSQANGNTHFCAHFVTQGYGRVISILPPELAAEGASLTSAQNRDLHDKGITFNALVAPQAFPTSLGDRDGAKAARVVAGLVVTLASPQAQGLSGLCWPTCTTK